MNAPHELVARESAVEEQQVVVRARDGYALAGTLYRRPGITRAPSAIVFNPGGGLAACRYRHFLRFLAGGGSPVLAYDYRGVGASRPSRLRGLDAGLEDWSEYDQAGAIDWLRRRYPHARMTGVSHSIGCLVACSAPNAGELAAIALVGPHTGYWRDYGRAWKLPMALLWHGIMPLVARTAGYFPGRRLRLGDDFPLRFARQWAGRRTPAFRIDADEPYRSRGQALLDRARALEAPVLAVSVSDDAFASAAGVARFIAAIPRAGIVRSEIDVRRVGCGRVGHFGFFSRRHASLWPIVTRFLEPPARLDSPAAVLPPIANG